MRQRLGIAAALLRDPRLLLLDEPTTGLDPPGMRDMRTLIGRLSERGVTVLLSSHQLAEVEEMCNRVAIIRSGQVVYEGVLAELKRASGGGYRLRSTDAARAVRVCEAQAGITQVRLDGHEVRFAAESDEAVAALSIALVEAGVGITALAPTGATLEELFFRLTEGEGANGAPVAPRVPAEAA
jgi:ABC-2 type transport system ATP-binding protein